jgi:sulfate adenylyltransferase subunit 2
MHSYKQSHLKQLEAESIFIIREATAEFQNPVMLYSVGKDSSTMLHLAYKAFYPGKIPFPIMHIDTGYKFPEMYQFRDRKAKKLGLRLIVERNEEWIAQKAHPNLLGNDKCCHYLKTLGLTNALKKHGFDAAFGGARREEEKSRAKERIYSVRDEFGQWNPKKQRPQIWNLYNAKIGNGESVRIFPLSNWTEIDVWQYIKQEKIEVVTLYFAKKRRVLRTNSMLIPVYDSSDIKSNTELVMCRFRTLGCIPCTGAIESGAQNIDEIIEELKRVKYSERENRIIDLTGESSMEEKKKEGYF